ncbi:hypothetical protein Rhopal_000279-T1 [Rhodotorula paludigena]|uniref:Uncharacterized protein n=1 Tax=Rhodotorula paludigena TaxID=86838 RepID=A0AAV5GCE3_9BASI|nr:hypothetical protein Rhopal_000279-T1 [Rhodotorula paludigena]
MAFAPNGASLYCGFENAIEILDVGSPGAQGSKEGQKVGLYDPSQPNPLVDLLWPSQRGGVTKVLFHPLSPHLLCAASRQSSHLDVWDLRNTSRPSSSGRLRRKARTNQRIGFDIDPSGTWLAAGDQPLPDELEPVTIPRRNRLSPVAPAPPHRFRHSHF